MLYLPRPYQQEGESRIMETPGFLMGYEPGSGKTVTALTAADRLMNHRLEVDRVLIVAPKMVAREVWWRETRKWAHLRHLRVAHIGTEQMDYFRDVTLTGLVDGEVLEVKKHLATREQHEALALAQDKGLVLKREQRGISDPKQVKRRILDNPAQIQVISRDNFYFLVKLLGKDWPWSMVLVDESTTFKSHGSQRSKAMWYLRSKGLVTRLVMMSGTPSPKGLEQLWAQVRLLDLGERLGTGITAFRERFMLPDKRNWTTKQVYSYKPQRGAVEEVGGLVKDICQSVTADVWRTNQEPLLVQVPVALPEAAREAYDRMEVSSVLRLGESLSAAANRGVLHGKLAQIASGALLDDDGKWHQIHAGKLDALEELVEQLDGEPLLVLYWFRSSAERLARRFPAVATIRTPGFLDKFARRELPILMINPASAGHGLDGLQHGGHHVAVFDLHADWEIYKQAVDRLDRYGQQSQVVVHQLVATGTVDETVADVLFDRAANQAKVLDAIAERFFNVRGRAK